MKNNNKFFTVLKERWQIYLLIGPFLILFVLMTVLPILSSVVLSFFNYDMVSAPSFSGVENYLRMFILETKRTIIKFKTPLIGRCYIAVSIHFIVCLLDIEEI